MKMVVRQFLVILLLIASAVLIVWSLKPVAIQKKVLRFASIDLAPKGQLLDEQTQEIRLRNRTLTLSWPEKIRRGETAKVEMRFLPFTTEDAKNPAQIIPDLQADNFGNYSVMVDAKLELSGLVFSPDGQISQLLLPDTPATFIWNIKAEQAVDYMGTAWTYLRFISKDTGQESRLVLSAPLLSIKGVDFWGLDLLSTRLIGSLGLAVGLVLSFESLLIRAWVRLFGSQHRER